MLLFIWEEQLKLLSYFDILQAILKHNDIFMLVLLFVISHIADKSSYTYKKWSIDGATS